MRALLFATFSLFFLQQSFAQDSIELSQEIGQIEVLAARNVAVFQTPAEVSEEFGLDFALRNEHLTVRNYGIVGLASISNRGKSAAHTTVKWNNLILNAPYHRLTDVSNLNPFLFERVNQINQNNHEGLGGSIELVSSSIKQEAFKMLLGINSLQNKTLAAQMHHQLKPNTTISWRFYESKNANKIQFYNPFTQQRELLKHAQLSSRHAMVGLEHILRSNAKLDVNLWHSQTEREIPPVKSAINSFANQKDISNRITFNYQEEGKRHDMRLLLGYVIERLAYEDQSKGINSLAQFYNPQAALDLTYTINSILLSFNPAIRYYHLENSGYDLPIDEVAGDFNIDVERKFRFAMIRLGISQKYQAAERSNLLPSVYYQQQILSHLHLIVFTSLNEQFPSMNDRFWLTGGNINLKKEQFKGGEIGLLVEREWLDSWKLHLKAVHYQDVVKNMIRWLPNTSGQFEASNTSRVYNRGLELDAKISRKRLIYQLDINSNYRYLRASLLDGEHASLKHQLIYQPKHQFTNSVGLSFQTIRLMLSHQMFDKQFIRDDLSKSISGYQLLDFSLSYSIDLGSFALAPSFGINNVFDEDYEVVANQVMPGRVYECALKLTHSK